MIPNVPMQFLIKLAEPKSIPVTASAPSPITGKVPINFFIVVFFAISTEGKINP